MQLSEQKRNQLINEIKLSATRSSGPGGQNVNKVSTKVELRFALMLSNVFTESEKQTISIKLASRINSEDELILVSSDERSQLRNREKVIDKFFMLLEKALTPAKKRIKTKPTRASKVKRLENKKLLSKKKSNRKRPEI